MKYAKCGKFIDSESSLVTQAKKFIHTWSNERAFVVWWICFLVVCLFCWKVLDIWSIVIQLDKFLSNRMLIPSNVQMEPSTLMKVGSMSVNVLNARRDTIVSQKAWKKRWIPCFFATNVGDPVHGWQQKMSFIVTVTFLFPGWCLSSWVLLSRGNRIQIFPSLSSGILQKTVCCSFCTGLQRLLLWSLL